MTTLSRHASVAEKFAQSRLRKMGERFAVNQLGAANERIAKPDQIGVGGVMYDRRAFEIGKLDRSHGYAEHENPFLMEPNRRAWDKGFERG